MQFNLSSWDPVCVIQRNCNERLVVPIVLPNSLSTAQLP